MPHALRLRRYAEDLPAGVGIAELDDAQKRIDHLGVVALSSLEPLGELRAVFLKEHGCELLAGVALEIVVNFEHSGQAASAMHDLHQLLVVE